MKKILIIGTGGTIAGKGVSGKSSNYTSGSISVKELISSIPGLNKIADFYFVQSANIDSCNMTNEIVYNIAKIIEENKSMYDGFLIIHGTDTMEETAFLLNLVLKTRKPVVITGAMRPATAISPDGFLNIYEAAVVAACDEAQGKGVLVSFAQGISSARDVQKITTFRGDAFNQRDLGLLGYVYENRVEFLQSPLKPHTLASEFSINDLKIMPPVPIISFGLNMDNQLIYFALKNYSSVVISGAGNGGYSNQWVEIMSSSDTPVIRCSRTGSGIISYDGRMDTKDSIICGGNLTPQKARLLVQLALTHSKDSIYIKEVFSKY